MEKLDIFSVYAIKYATVNRKSSENFIAGDPHEILGSMDYYVWVLKSESQVFLVDTGFNSDAAKKRGRTLLRCPTQGLELLGIKAADISSVILTHLHYDHAGNIDLFPNAHFYIQEREVIFSTGRHMSHSFVRAPYNVEDVILLLKEIYQGKVVFVDGSYKISSGLHVHCIGGHCPGLQVVQVWTKNGWVVLASDATHFYDNFEKKHPFPIVFNVGEMLDGYDKLSELASSTDLIIPGHDPEVMNRFAPPFDEVKGIIAKIA